MLQTLVALIIVTVFGLIQESSTSDINRDVESTSKTSQQRAKAIRKAAMLNGFTRCGDLNHSAITRPCRLQDEYCGNWEGRFWNPHGCYYDDISPEQARKCLGNRTLAFVGDSMIRDTCVGVAYLLMGMTLEASSDKKFDKNFDMNTNATKIEDFSFWKNNVPPHNYNGHIFPQKDVALKNNWPWQIQMWSLYCNNYLRDQVQDIFQNKLVGLQGLRKIDLLFWNHGLHDWGWFHKPPQGRKYYDHIVAQWLRERKKPNSVPSIWLAMNPNCKEKNAVNVSPEKNEEQFVMVERSNKYANEKLLKDKQPYWDTAAVLRTPSRCNHSADGVHVKMYVDIMRAKMLFNHLCDKDMNWRGSEAYFV